MLFSSHPLKLFANFFPRARALWVGLVLGETALQLHPLGVRNRQGVRILRKAVPDGLDESKALVDAQLPNCMYVDHGHTVRITRAGGICQYPHGPHG
mgnify:CR=1 FL=1